MGAVEAAVGATEAVVKEVAPAEEAITSDAEDYEQEDEHAPGM